MTEEIKTDTAEDEAKVEEVVEETQEPSPEEELRSGLESLAEEQAGENTEEQPSGEEEAQKKEEIASEELTEAQKTEAQAVADAKAKAEAEAAAEPKDEFFEGLPEDHPNSEHWKGLRDQYKGKKLKVKELEARVKELEANPPAQAAQPRADHVIGQRQPQALEKKYGADFLVETLAKVNSGDVGEEFRQEAETYLAQTISPAELREVMTKAQAGGFGEQSVDMLNIARERLPVALSMESENRQQQAQAAQYEQIKRESFKEVQAAYPGFEDDKTDNGKLFSAAFAELRESIPGIEMLPNALKTLQNFVELRAASGERDTLKTENSRLSTELDLLRKKHGVITSPQAGGGSTTNQKPKNQTPESSLRDGLAGLGVGT